MKIELTSVVLTITCDVIRAVLFSSVMRNGNDLVIEAPALVGSISDDHQTLTFTGDEYREFVSRARRVWVALDDDRYDYEAFTLQDGAGFGVYKMVNNGQSGGTNEQVRAVLANAMMEVTGAHGA